MSYLETEESLLWGLGAAANAASAVLLLALAAGILTALARTRQLGRNPLGYTVAGVFALTGLSHALHVGFFMLPVAHRPFMVATVSLDLVCTLTVGAYLLMRWRGASTTLYDDLQRDERALRSNDRVVQRLTEASLALELGQDDVLRRALDDGLQGAKAICEDLVRLRGEAA